MTFNDAYNYMRANQDRKITRAAWATGTYLQWHTNPDVAEILQFVNGVSSVWQPQQADILALDWQQPV